MSRVTPLVAALAVASAPAIGWAADVPVGQPSVYTSPQPASTWIVTVKGTLTVSPKYEGADSYSVFGYPSLSFRRASSPERFSAPDDGISIGLLETDRFRIGPVVRFRGQRESKGETIGLRKVDFAVEAGVFAEFWVLDWLRTRAELRHGFGGHHGIVGDIGADVVQTYGAWTLSAGPRMGFGNEKYFDRYFSVTPAEAAANPTITTAYDAGSGIRYAGLAAAATYRWNEAWRTTVFGGYQRLVGDVKSSPIVAELGSRDQFNVGVSLSYSFGVNW